MISKKYLILLIFICLFSASLLAQPNLKWLDTAINMSIPNPKTGDVVKFSATFRCAREAADNAKAVAFIDGCPYYTQKYPHLNKGEDVIFSFKWPTTFGNHKIEMQLDPDKTITEYLENDNTLVKAFNVRLLVSNLLKIKTTSKPSLLTLTKKPFTLLKPDLYATISMNPASPASGTPVLYSIKVHNSGAKSKPCKISVQLQTYSLEPNTLVVALVIQEYDIQEIAKGGSQQVDMQYTIKYAGSYQILVKVDKNNDVAESKEDNNEANKIFKVL